MAFIFRVLFTSLLFLSFLSLNANAQDLRFESKVAKSTGEQIFEVHIDEANMAQSLQKGNILELHLDDKKFLQSIVRKTSLRYGYTGISGQPVQGNSYSNLMVKNGKISGILHFDGKPYRLQHSNGQYTFFEISEEVHSCSFDGTQHIISAQKMTSDSGLEFAVPSYDIANFNDTTTVDILVLYTTDAKNWADTSSSVADIYETLAYNEAIKNTILENSELALKIRFVEFLEIASNNTLNNEAILTAIQQNDYASISSSDTVDIDLLRGNFGADLISLIDVTNGGGLGYQINGIGGSSEAGFSVSRVQQLHFTTTLMHEVGHNFGNAHGRTQSTNAATDKGGVFQFSTGHYLTVPGGINHNTVMHYGDSNSSEIPYFSNPRVLYAPDSLNIPTGSYQGEGGPSDNVLSMSITKDWIADYMHTVVDPASISLATTAIADTIFPSGVSRKQIIIQNTGNSDLEIDLDGEMNFSSSLKRSKTIQQKLDLSYNFEEDEGFEAGSYTGYNNWISVDDQSFEISTSLAASGSQSLKASATSAPYIQSPYFATNSRYTSYTITMKVYSEVGPADAYLEFSSANRSNAAAGLLLQSNGTVGFYGMNGTKSYWTASGDQQLPGEWVDVNISISPENGGTISYQYGPNVARTFTGNGYYHPEIFYLAMLSSSSNNVYIDDIHITAEDLYGPTLTIDDSQTTIPAGQTDTMTVTFYGNGYDAGNYDGNIFLETNDPSNEELSISVNLRIDPNSLHFEGRFAVELTGQPGFRLLSAPSDVNLKDFLDPLHTQGAVNADVPNGSANVWIWNKNFSGSNNTGWIAVTDLDTTINAGDAFLTYVFDESDYGDSTSRGFPKLLNIDGVIPSSATPIINQHEDGLTLIGNPFASTVQWDEIYANAGSDEITGSVYIYDPDVPGWKSYSIIDGGMGGFDGLIKPFQGFFVQSSGSISNGPAVSFESNDIRSGGQFYGKSRQKKFAQFQVSNSDLSNSAYVVFSQQANLNKDDLDAIEMTPFPENYLLLSSKSKDGIDLDINSVPEFKDSFRLPISIEAQGTNYATFSLVEASGLSDVSIQLTNGDWVKDVTRHTPVELELVSQKTSKWHDISRSKPINSPVNSYELIFKKQRSSSIEEENLPQEFSLFQNYPNPFNPSTIIKFGIPASSHVKLSVYNVLGQLVNTLVNGPKQAGYYTVNFDAINLSSGVYLYRLEAGGFVDTQKMILMK